MRSCVFVLMLLLNPLGFGQQQPEAPSTEKIRAELLRREQQRARLRLRDGTEIKAKIVSLSSDAVTVAPEPKSLPGRTIPLADVAKVSGAGMTRGQKWAVFGVAWVAAGALFGGFVNH